MIIKQIKTYTLLFLLIGVFQAHSEEEAKIVEHLITITEQQLGSQRELQKNIILFNEHKERFLKGEQTIACATLLVKTATHILKTISENHLQHLFSSEYMEELALFTSIGAKKSPSRP